MRKRVLRNCRIARISDKQSDYVLLEKGAIAMAEGHIVWVGNDAALPKDFAKFTMTDLGGRLVTPSFIDCHTHIVHGGNRVKEFEMRLNGKSYVAIAKAGGGIISTVSATRVASEDMLLEEALPRVDALISEGVGTLEIKSGYGLDQDTELKMLRTARRIAKMRPVEVITSFLGAHALPAEYKSRAKDYISEVCLPTLRAAVEDGLVDIVDAFCEGIAFQPEELVPLFDLAQSLNIPIKLHAEQLSNLGGAQLAARYGALSADHLEYLDETGVSAMASANMVAVLLPGAFYTLRETNVPPVDLFRAYNVPIALASDANPGSSPMTSLLLTMNMACTIFRLTPEEALSGVTRHAAQALGLRDRGLIIEGYRADLAVWNVKDPAELAYRIGFNPLYQRIFGGV
mgnify:CR=1 FL=1